MNSKHMLIMALCCLIPLAGFFVVSAFGIDLAGLGTVALVLLCPLLHILMMRGMGSHTHGSQNQPSCHPQVKSDESRGMSKEAMSDEPRVLSKGA